MNECSLFVYDEGGVFGNKFCVVASMCYAESTTDVLLLDTYPNYVKPPTSEASPRLDENVFHNITGGAETMTLQNAIDAYYWALVSRTVGFSLFAALALTPHHAQTGTWISAGGPFGAYSPEKTSNNGPYPTSYVIQPVCPRSRTF